MGIMSLTLARHETFVPRYGWLKKAYDKREAFQNRDDAHILLGVGKNMARSMEYWAKAFRLYTEAETGQSTLVHEATEFADRIFDDKKGLDPFLENDGTLWLLHYNLVKKNSLATAWEFAFNDFNQRQFKDNDLREALMNYVKTKYPDKQIADSSFTKDTNAILRMYTNYGATSSTPEDTLDSPFTRLSLIGYDTIKKQYYFNQSQKYNLPDSIIAAISMQFIYEENKSARTYSIKDLAYSSHGPGRLLKISEYTIEHAFENLIPIIPGIHLRSEAGILLLSFTEDVNTIKDNILLHYYKK